MYMSSVGQPILLHLHIYVRLTYFLTLDCMCMTCSDIVAESIKLERRYGTKRYINKNRKVEIIHLFRINDISIRRTKLLGVKSGARFIDKMYWAYPY